MDNRTKTALIVTAIVIIVTFYYGLRDPFTPTSANNAEKAPDFSLKTLEGKTVTLDTFKGKPLLLIFGATWCPACIEEAPVLERANREFKDEVNIVFASIRSPRQDLDNMIKKFKITYTMAESNDQAVADYGVQSIPATFFINKRGEIVDYAVGATEELELRGKIKSLLLK